MTRPQTTRAASARHPRAAAPPTESALESALESAHGSAFDSRNDPRTPARTRRAPPSDLPTLRTTGTWFDGVTSRRHRVRLRLSARSLRIAPDDDAAVADGGDIRHRLVELRIGERWRGAPLVVALSDGGTLWVDDRDDSGGGKGPLFSQALNERVARARRSRRWRIAWPRAASLIGSWPAVIACLLATLVLLVWFDRRGASLAATAALKVVPTSIDRRIGDAAWKPITRDWLTKSEIDVVRQLRVRQRFREIAAQVAPDTSVDLRFHRMRGSLRFVGRGGGGQGKRGDNHDIDEDDEAHDATGSAATTVPSSSTVPQPTSTPQSPPPDRRRGDGGFNAFALPNGTIVVLDGLVERLNDDELMAVLGHELGHVVHRHTMKGVMRSASLLSVAGVVLGDFSSVVASSVATLQALHYGRDDEREADAFGRAFAETAKLPPGTEARVWRKFMKEEKRMRAAGIPAWLSSHPPSEERLKAAEEAR